MFHWICPECGREIAPTVRECPACDSGAATVENAPAGDVEAPARASEAPPAGRPASTPGAEAQLGGTDEVRLPQHAERDIPPALAAPIAAVSPLAARNSQRVAETESADALLPQFGATDGGRQALDQFSAMLDSMDPDPPPASQPLPLPMRALPRVRPAHRQGRPPGRLLPQPQPYTLRWAEYDLQITGGLPLPLVCCSGCS